MPSLIDLYRDRIATLGFTDDPHQHAAITVLQRVFDDMVLAPKPGLFRRARPVRGAYIHGPVGRGKSMVMDLFYDQVPAEIGKRRVHFHAFMIGVHDFLHQYRQSHKGASDGPDQALLIFAANLLRDVRVLCFDEFHVVDVADAMILSRLFTALLDKGLVVIATSNWPPDRLYEGGLQRDRFLSFIGLVKDRMDVVSLSGPTDYRLRKLEDDGVYRWPLGHHAQDWADGLFTALTGGAAMDPVQLTVKGRVMDVTRTAAGVARFGFAELCERPLGAEDYLAIATGFHTVFLEGIPKLRYDRRNEVKRLMVLIDAFYENGTRLIITADAPPDKLYYGHDHSFEFERTVSRLLEMQSKAWLEKTERMRMVP